MPGLDREEESLRPPEAGRGPAAGSPRRVASAARFDPMSLADTLEEEIMARRRKRRLIGLATGLVLLFASLVWFGFDRRSAPEGELPLIAAPEAPARSAPDDPGGLRIPFQEELVLNEESDGIDSTKVEKLLAPPEKPIDLSQESDGAEPSPEETVPLGSGELERLLTEAAPSPDAPKPADGQAVDPIDEPLPPVADAGPSSASDTIIIEELGAGTAGGEGTALPSLADIPAAAAILAAAQESLDGGIREDAATALDEELAAAENELGPRAHARIASLRKPETASDAIEDLGTVGALGAVEDLGPEEGIAPDAAIAAEGIATSDSTLAADGLAASVPEAEEELEAAATEPPAAAPEPAPAPIVPEQVSRVPMPDDGYAVQIGALNSPAAAQAEWRRIAELHPDTLGDLAPAIEEADVSGSRYYRIKAGPLGSKREAERRCAALKSAGQDCLVTRF